MKIVKNPDVVQVVVERVRWKIWNLLKLKGSLTAEEIAEELNKDTSTIYRHLKKLIVAEFVQETEVRKGKQKYFVKKYSAKLTDSLFLLSEQEEKLIASNPGEIPYLKGFIPRVLKVFKELGFIPQTEKEEQRVLELLSEYRMGNSYFLYDLFQGKDEYPALQRNEDFNEVLEFLQLFLVLANPDFHSRVTEIMNILVHDKQIFLKDFEKIAREKNFL